MFYALLISSGKYTFLPELYDIFGRESTIKFLEVFAGCRVKVPTIEKLEVLARNTAIYVRIEKASSKQKHVIVKSLSEEYDVTEDSIRATYVKTKYQLEKELGFRLLPRKRRG